MHSSSEQSKQKKISTHYINKEYSQKREKKDESDLELAE